MVSYTKMNFYQLQISKTNKQKSNRCKKRSLEKVEF